MIKLSSDETKLLRKVASKELPLVVYTEDNKVEFTEDHDPKYTTKFTYDPWVSPADSKTIENLKDRGVSEVVRCPFYIQKKLNSASRNDRFKNLPAMVLGEDQNNDLYFYQKGKGNEFRDVKVSGMFRIPTRKRVDSSKSIYHVYSPFNKIGKRGLFDQNYSLKVLSSLVTDNLSEDMLAFFKLFVKGVLITQCIVPDYIVTIKSSKSVNSELLKLFKSDKYFNKVKFIEIEKPSTFDVKSHYTKGYLSGKYPNDDSFINQPTDEKFSMRELSPESRELYGRICKELLEKAHKDIDVKSKDIIFFDDLITTGSTLTEMLIPLFEQDGSRILPFTFLMR